MIKNLLFILLFLSVSVIQAQTADEAKTVIQNYLVQKLGDQSHTIDYEITFNHLDQTTGVYKVHALQKINGIYYRDGILTISMGHFNRKSIVDHFYYDSEIIDQSRIDAESAARSALAYHDLPVPTELKRNSETKQQDQEVTFVRNEGTASDIIARYMYIKGKKNGTLVKTWETQVHTADRQNYWVTYIHAGTGQVLESEDKVLHCSFGDGLVYDASPEEQAQIDAAHHAMHMRAARHWEERMNMDHQKEHSEDHRALSNNMMAPVNGYLVLDAPAEAPNDTLGVHYTQDTVYTAGDAIASPFGWTSTDGINQNTHTKGNNVWAFHDPSPGPLGGAPNPVTGAQNTGIDPITMEQQFIYPWDLSQEPEYSTADPTNQFPNRNAAIVNLFYWNNLIHDVYYQFGFTETGRNFQFDNQQKGGVGNDEVLAQAQDGGGTNNANFLTLTDGVNGQMQMYLWTSSVLDSLVQIDQVSISTTVAGGDGFPAIQGALYNSANQPPTTNLVTNPVLMKEYILVNDGCGSSEGCGAGGGVGVAPCNDVTDKIVLIDRGSCSFVEKVDGAQKGGAVGVIVMNNDAGNPDAVLAMGGTDPTVNTITIPAVMVSYNSGQLLKQALADGATVVGSLKQENLPQPKRDGDFDNGIIAHEYGHGITIRTSPQNATGGTLSGSEQGGEGWADYIALYMTGTNSDLGAPTVDHPNGVLPDRGIGTYVRYDLQTGAGIRPRKYSIDESVNEYTFTGATNGGFGIGNSAEITVPHGVGFVWCTILWELTQNLVDLYGFNDDIYYVPPVTGDYSADSAVIQANNAGNNLAMKLILEGISLQTPSPRFVDMRDGILMADTLLYNGAHSCLLWEAFAKRGLGINAIDPTNAIGDELDGYATPCDPSQVFVNIKKSAVGSINNRSQIQYSLEAINNSYFENEATNVEVVDVLPEHLIFLDASGAPFVISNDTIIFTIASLPFGDTVELTIDAFVNTPEHAIVSDEYGYEDDAQGWTVVTGGGNSFTRVTGDPDNAHSGEAFFFSPNNGFGGANTMLISPQLDTSITNKQIRFWHKFHTDAGYDGGFLETTIDGATWTRLPVQENGYNGALNSTFNPVNAGAAFTGFTAGYIESAAALPDDALQVRFVFSEDVEFGEEGWWIDDVRIVENPVSVVNTAIVEDEPSSGGRVQSDQASTLVTTEAENHPCEYVTLKVDEGVGSLPFAIGCAFDGDTIRFDVNLHMDTIKLVTNQAMVDKDLVFNAAAADSIFVFGENVLETFKILAGKTVVIQGLHIISGQSVDGGSIFNEGTLELDEVHIYENENVSPAVLIKNKGMLQVKGNTRVKIE